MMFKMHVKDEQSDWWEDFGEYANESAATARAEEYVARFNSGLRQGETTRTLLGVAEDSGAKLEHNWQKQNAFTREDHRGMFDIVKCARCGCEARRYGLRRIVRGQKFRAKKWAVCTENPTGLRCAGLGAHKQHPAVGRSESKGETR